MRVAVTGATGNVGTALVDALARDPAVSEVVGLARRRPEYAPPKARFVACDVTRDDLEPHLRGVDAVVHLAWRFQPTHRPEVTWWNNVGGSARVFAATATSGVRALVYASSVGAYSPRPGGWADETWPTHALPTAGYGREKSYVERLLDTFELAHPEVRVVRLRPSFLFQRVAASEQRRIFAGPLLPNAAARRIPVLPFPRGLRFQALHTTDAADAYRLAVVGDARGAFNVAGTPVIDGPTLADALGARLVTVPPLAVRGALALGWHLRLVPAEPALLDLVRSLPLLDTTRARRVLGWTPTVPATDAVLEMVRGVAEGAGAATPPLRPDGARERAREVLRVVTGRTP